MTFANTANSHRTTGHRTRSLLGVGGTAFLTASFTLLAAGNASAESLPTGCIVENPTTVACTYASTGAEQSFLVPSGVHTIDVVAVGGRGAESYESRESERYAGAKVTGALPVTPGATLVVFVAGDGSSGNETGVFNGGFNGGGTGAPEGGGGGGATDVRTSADLASRLIVAGGGGGGGLLSPGGAAGTDGTDSPFGENTQGRAGTDTAGGAGGIYPYDDPALDGLPGSLGRGGDANHLLSGGGGGGLYGGGAASLFAGGGGGSSLVPPGGTYAIASESEAPSLTIRYTRDCIDFGSLDPLGSVDSGALNWLCNLGS